MPILLANIEAALCAEDVEGLIAEGAPSDEYDSEAKQIASALAKVAKPQPAETDIVAAIALIWEKSFNRSAQEIEQRMPAFQRIAHRLL